MNKKYILIVSLLLIITGCKKACPDGYTSYDDKCYKYENIEPTIEYYCNSGGVLEETKCIVTSDYNCSMISDKEICTETHEYPASKTYNCPNGYDLNGNKCSKIIYLK